MFFNQPARKNYAYSVEKAGYSAVHDISGILRLTMKLEEGVNTIPTAYMEKGFYMMKIAGKERVFNWIMVK